MCEWKALLMQVYVLWYVREGTERRALAVWGSKRQGSAKEGDQGG